MSLLIAFISLVFAGRLILKNYNPQAVLFFYRHHFNGNRHFH